MRPLGAARCQGARGGIALPPKVMQQVLFFAAVDAAAAAAVPVPPSATGVWCLTFARP